MKCLTVLYFVCCLNLIWAGNDRPDVINVFPLENLRSDTTRIDSLLRLSWSLARKDPIRSLELLDTIAAIHDRKQIKYKIDVLYYYCGVINKNLGRFDVSENYLNKYEQFHLRSKRYKSLAGVSIVKANLYSDQGLWDKSMIEASKSLGYAEQGRDTATMIVSLGKMGYILSEINRGDDALFYHNKCLRLASYIRDSLEIGIAYTNIGIVYEKKLQLDSALLFYEKSRQINENLKHEEGLLNDNYNIGNIYIKLKAFEQATPHVQKALELAHQIKMPGYIAMCKMLNATLLLERGNLVEGVKILETVLQNEVSFLSLKDQAEIYESLILAYKSMGKPNEILQYLDPYLDLKDSLLNSNVTQQINQLEAQYQSNQKTQEIALLNSRNKLNRLELLRQMEFQRSLERENGLIASLVDQEKFNNVLLERENTLKKSELEKEQALLAAEQRENAVNSQQLIRERNFRLSLSVATALLLLAGGLIFILYHRQRAKNAIILRQSNELQVLLKEIHHRVKNNLQVISSLLDLQSHNIEDKQAIEAVNAGKNRVQSMALIHQNLYSEDNLKGINARDYIHKLLNSLCASYNIHHEQIRIQSDVEDLNLDVDTMIPLGLILNELISNSIKYAFQKTEFPELYITLKSEPAHLYLKVKDNGKGFPDTIQSKTGSGFGLKMIRAFAQKLKAQLDFYNQNGAVVEMKIRKYSLA